MIRRALLATNLLAALALAVPAGASAPSCPAPKTCPAFVLATMRWPVKPGQSLVIPYYVSTRLDSVNYPASGLPAVAAAATKVWERANPRVHFRYLGTTDALPGNIADGKNVIGFGVPEGAPGLEAADASLFFTQDDVLFEADVTIDPKSPWVWQSCPQRDGGCSGHSREFLPNTWGPELQGVLEHELGHWLSLDHSDAQTTLDGSLMTMFSTTHPDNLAQQTLGLGDILGVRAAYPCGRCGGPPTVYAP